jgi:hypothetical protein
MSKILTFDLETAGVNARRSDLGFVILFGYKWSYEKKAGLISIDRKSLAKFDDKKLLVSASRIMEEADLVVGHFASIFDRRFFQGRLLINGLPPIPPTKMRDTCLIARSVGNFSSNRLKHLAKILKLKHQKLENNWPDAWFQVMRGNMKVLREMGEYCKGDVLATEELYTCLTPFDNSHPRMITDRSKCRLCGGEVEYRGFSYVGERAYRRFVCKKCRRWDRERRGQ